MRSVIFNKRATFLPRPPRWKKRLLYVFALFGVVALSGLTFIVYLALQVPEDQLKAGIPFPKLATPVEKSEPIPDVKNFATEKPAMVGAVPAYALFYTTKSPGEDSSKLGRLHSPYRPKQAKRSPSAVKAKRSS
jgi:hypothetical protein